MTSTTDRSLLTPADESFTHQEVAPIAATAYVSPRWAERCWHLVNVGEGWVLGVGRALWRHDGRRTAVAGLSTGKTQWSVRTAEPFASGDDPNRPDVGAIRIETVVPFAEARMTLTADEASAFAFDLTWRARFPPVQTDRNRIERQGQVVTDYMNYYHPGLFSGVVTAGGERREIHTRSGFRDRGWGLRHHEGAARRGMHVFVGCELPDRAIYLLLYEKASGERALTNGWVISPEGATDLVVAADHDLVLDGRRLVSGTVVITLASGALHRIDITVEGRLAMEALGYTAVPGRADPGQDVLDLTDAAVVAAWDGLYDNACLFDVDGVTGHGFVEVGLGIHARYLPEETA